MRKMTDMYDVGHVFTTAYVRQLSQARYNDSTDEPWLIRRDALRMINEMRTIVKAVDLLERYGCEVTVR